MIHQLFKQNSRSAVGRSGLNVSAETQRNLNAEAGGRLFHVLPHMHRASCYPQCNPSSHTPPPWRKPAGVHQPEDASLPESPSNLSGGEARGGGASSAVPSEGASSRCQISAGAATLPGASCCTTDGGKPSCRDL